MPATDKAKRILQDLFHPKPEYEFKPIFKWINREDLHSHDIKRNGVYWGHVNWCGQLGSQLYRRCDLNGIPLSEMKKLIPLLDEVEKETITWLQNR